MPTVSPPSPPNQRPTASRFVLRGLAIVLPPILTIVILIWMVGVINDYIIAPTSYVVRFTIAQFVDESRPTDELVGWDRLPPLEFWGRNYRVTSDLKDKLSQRWQKQGRSVPPPEESNGTESPVPVAWLEEAIVANHSRPQVYIPLGERAVPYRDYAVVAGRVHAEDMPTTATGVYMELVTLRYFKSLFHLSAAAVVVVVILLYFIGGLVTARIGAWFVHKFDSNVMARLPLVSNVYSSVKQVTDFFFTERTVEYNRVVAVEYPRRGMWSIGFVTGDSMLEMTAAAGEPLVAVMMPTSPMPFTGFTVSVPRSEVVDLNITLDQAFQFCLSCGVLVPDQQKVTPDLLQQELARRLTQGTYRARAAGDSKIITPPQGPPPRTDADHTDETEGSS